MSLDVSRIHLVCFDVDGTLSDTDDQWVLKTGAFLRPAGFLFPQKDPMPFARRVIMAMENPGTLLFGIPDRLNIDRYLVRLTEAIHRKGIDQKMKQFLVIEGVREMLALLQPHFTLAIVTTRSLRYTQAFLNQSGLASIFQIVATSQTCRHTKPFPDPILWAASQIGISPSSCLMVGDTTVDIRAGKAAGAQTVGVLCGFGEQDELLKAGADLILSSTRDLSRQLVPAESLNNPG